MSEDELQHFKPSLPSRSAPNPVFDEPLSVAEPTLLTRYLRRGASVSAVGWIMAGLVGFVIALIFTGQLLPLAALGLKLFTLLMLTIAAFATLVALAWTTSGTNLSISKRWTVEWSESDEDE